MRFHRGHFSVAVALFFIELAIALFVDDAFVRPYLGDVLVIPLVYCFIATFVDIRPALLSLLVFGFACAVEFGQRGNLLNALGLEDNRVARTVLGTSYSTLDLVAYAVGAGLTLAIHLGAQRLRGGLIGERRVDSE